MAGLHPRDDVNFHPKRNTTNVTTEQVRGEANILGKVSSQTMQNMLSHSLPRQVATLRRKLIKRDEENLAALQQGKSKDQRCGYVYPKRLTGSA